MRACQAALAAEGMHPLVWGVYVLHSDPFATFDADRRSAADLVLRWPSLVTRYLAAGQ